MKILVLGSAAGGGFPQWNCNCTNCRAVRAGSAQHVARTQSSIAAGGPHDWVLVNASPDILTQLQRNPACTCCASAARRCRCGAPIRSMTT